MNVFLSYNLSPWRKIKFLNPIAHLHDDTFIHITKDAIDYLNLKKKKKHIIFFNLLNPRFKIKFYETLLHMQDISYYASKINLTFALNVSVMGTRFCAK